MLESVAETEGDTRLSDGAAGQDSLLPTDDDIEKSFRVNQDGSMTVEMKVRLTIKEEETIHWTTTLSRSSVASQLNVTCLPEAEQDISSLKSNSLDLQSPAASIDTINRDKTEDNNDEDPPSLGTGALSQSGNEEDHIKVQTDIVSPRRVPTPGHKQIRKQQASVESITSVTAEGAHEGMIGSYSYREKTEYGAMTEQYCMVKQSNTKPVPKPRRLGSVDANNINSRNVSTIKSGMAEILQIESSREEVTETVLHIYEQQTCHDNFLANFCGQSMSASGIPFCRPATSGSGQLSSNNDFEHESWRPSTASESISIWRTETMSVTSDSILPSLNTGAIKGMNVQQQFPKPTHGKVKPQQSEVNKDKRVSLKPKVINKRVGRLMSPRKRQKENSAQAAEKRKKGKVKTFSSAGFIKKIYGNKSKSPKSMMKLKKGIQKGDGSVATGSAQQSDDIIKCILKDPNIPPAVRENTSETVFLEKIMLNVSPNDGNQQRGILTRQTSMHQEKKNENESYDVNETMSLPALNSCSSVTNEYVENWLEKSQTNPTTCENEKSRKAADTLVQTENAECGEPENKDGLITVAEKVKCLEQASETQTCQTLKTDLPPEMVRRASVKQRIKSFEKKLSCQATEKRTGNQQVAHSHTTIINTENCNSVAQNNVEEIRPLSQYYCPETIPPTDETSTQMPSGSEVENKSSSIKISLQKAESSNSFTMDLPFPPPPPAENLELSNTEYCTMDVLSAASSPLYRLSSVSSQMSDNHPLSISPTSDDAISPTDHTMEITTSIQADIHSTLEEEPLPRTQSIKRAPLVSNLSFDRKMSLRKACVDKNALCTDATSETNTSSSTPINIGDDNVLPNSICSTRTQRLSEMPLEETQQSNSFLDLKNSPSFCTSASPTSLTSEERMSSASILSSEGQPESDLSFKETQTSKTQLLTQTEKTPLKPLVKKVKLVTSPSPERKPQTKKVSTELPHNSPKLSSIYNHPPDKTMSPNVGRRKNVTPDASPSTERKHKLYNPKVQKRSSPYSQSLDMASPPVKQKSSRKLLSRNLSSDNTSKPTVKIQRRKSLERKHYQTSHSMKSAELHKTPTCNTAMPLEADLSDDKVSKADDLVTQRPKTNTQVMPEPLNTLNQPNMKPVLEEICYSIKSIRQITQNKRPSCLEKSNSLPDFSSHVASTFGSSSKALLAFLSVMTLKEGITNLNTDELNANSVSCAEALKMIDSLREIASIEDSHILKDSLSDLQRSASKQLLQSWKGFQELSEKCKSRSSTPNDSEQGIVIEASPGIDENVIDEIMDNLGIPEELKEELASLSADVNSDSDSDSDDEEVMSARIITKVELSPKDNNETNISHFSTEATVKVTEVTQDEKVNVNVSAIIKQFTDINQPKPFSTSSITETKKNKPSATKDEHSEPSDEQIDEKRNLSSTVLMVEENEEGVESCRDAVNQEDQQQQQQGHNEDKSNQEMASMSGDVSTKKNHDQDRFNSEVKEKVMEGDQLQMHSEESLSISENELTYDNDSGSEQGGQNKTSANNDLEQRVSCEQSEASSEAGEQHSSEEESDIECEGIRQESRDSEDLSNPESHSEEEEDEQPSSDYYAELNVRGKGRISSTESQNKSLSEEEQPDVEKELSNKDASPASPSNSVGEEQQSQAGPLGLHASADESTIHSDVEEPSSEEEQPEVECEELKAGKIKESLSSNKEEQEEKHLNKLEAESKKLKVIIEESLSGNEEEQESVEEEEHPDDLSAKRYSELKTLIEEADEDKVSSDDDDHYADEAEICDETKSQTIIELGYLIESQDSFTKNNKSSLIKSDRLAKRYRFSADEDSGNDHSSCEEHVEAEQPKVRDEQTSSSIEELSLYEKESSSEEEHEIVDRYIEEGCTEHQEASVEIQSGIKNRENVKPLSEEMVSQSIAERVLLLEKQVADAQTRKNTKERSPVRRLSQRHAPPEPDREDSPSDLPTSDSALGSQSAPQSSLSFSYDSSGVITSEPEGRVRSIREMFLAKSTTDIQHGHCRFQSPRTSEFPELRAETSASGGYQSQSSNELSSGEDDSARKSITKGFVRRTIERLYGKKDANPDEEEGERPPSAPKQKKKEHSSIFSPFHIARSKAVSELSYFSSTNALDTFTEATRCIAFNTQVAPGDSVTMDGEQWLLRENALIRKSLSDPVGINKAFMNSPQGEKICKDTEESTPYSLFSTASELEDKMSLPRKCTYFSLPHASDSDACQDDLSTVSKSSVNGDSVIDTKDNPEDTKTWAERNGALPGVGVTDFKMKDNKVHPLVEPPPVGAVVVAQPGRGQGVMSRRLQEPDILDELYDFCGQNCPIL